MAAFLHPARVPGPLPVPRVSQRACPWEPRPETCPACGQAGGMQVRTWTETRSGRTVDQWRCAGCGLRWRVE